MMETKLCRSCWEEKPLSEFYVYRKPWKGGFRESIRPDCSSCENKESYRRQQENERLSKYVIRDWHWEISFLKRQRDWSPLIQ